MFQNHEQTIPEGGLRLVALLGTPTFFASFAAFYAARLVGFSAIGQVVAFLVVFVPYMWTFLAGLQFVPPVSVVLARFWARLFSWNG